MALLHGKDVLVGVIDVATDRVETPEEVAHHHRGGHGIRPTRAAVPLHELRHGPDDSLRRAGETRRARSGRGFGAAAAEPLNVFALSTAPADGCGA